MILVQHGVCFFFQAEDGIRDYKVTGVQTCALPICEPSLNRTTACCSRRRRLSTKKPEQRQRRGTRHWRLRPRRMGKGRGGEKGRVPWGPDTLKKKKNKGEDANKH